MLAHYPSGPFGAGNRLACKSALGADGSVGLHHAGEVPAVHSEGFRRLADGPMGRFLHGEKAFDGG
jgi:hypothetical protein